FSSVISVSFWKELASRKLDTYRLGDGAQPVAGFFAAQQDPRQPARLTLTRDSFPAADVPGATAAPGPGPAAVKVACLRDCRVPGALKNVNTAEAFKALDKNVLLSAAAAEVWAEILSGAAVAEPERLARFLLLSFADLKRNTFLYWCAFPALVSPRPFRLRYVSPGTVIVPAAAYFTEPERDAIDGGLTALRYTRAANGQPDCPLVFLVVRSGRNGGSRGSGGGEGSSGCGGGGDSGGEGNVIRVANLAEFEALRTAAAEPLASTADAITVGAGDDVIFALIDPCPLANNPGWPLRNLLALLAARWRLRRATVLCYRSRLAVLAAAATTAAAASLSGWDVPTNAATPVASPLPPAGASAAPLPSSAAAAAVAAAAAAAAPSSASLSFVSAAVANSAQPPPPCTGWEPNARGKMGPRLADLSAVLDARKLAEQGVSLNLKLMRWRLLPQLDTDTLAATKCLLLGAGTLGCGVARCLLGWGVTHMTLIDNGRVSFSNPARQSLFELDDCLDGGAPKAAAAAARLRKIHPGCRAEGIQMTIAMPGHPV
ncbi:unnamed protein product, partial [Phaeothamnion confervicola]